MSRLSDQASVISAQYAEIDALRSSLSAAEKERDGLREEVGKALPVQWTKGEPPFPFCDEWFIAHTIHGDKVVLKSLPKEYSYDYTTADGTYMKRENVKAWMQLPGSEYVSFALRALTAERDEFKAELANVKRHREEAEDRCVELLDLRDQITAERDTALRERDELRESLNRERQLSDVKCANLAEIGYQNFQSAGAAITTLADILTSIKTALNCPSLPIEELAGKVGEVGEVVRWQSFLCDTCHGIGEITVQSGQTPESYSVENVECPDCVGKVKAEAFTKGAEWMREEAANKIRQYMRNQGYVLRANMAADVILSLPIHPKEGE